MTTKFDNLESYINFIDVLPEEIVYLTLCAEPKKPYKDAFNDEVAKDAEYKIVTYTSIGVFVFREKIDPFHFPDTYEQIKHSLHPKIVKEIDFEDDSIKISDFID